MAGVVRLRSASVSVKAPEAPRMKLAMPSSSPVKFTSPRSVWSTSER